MKIPKIDGCIALTVVGTALTIVGSIVKGVADDKKMQGTIAEEVAKQLNNIK